MISIGRKVRLGLTLTMLALVGAALACGGTETIIKEVEVEKIVEVEVIKEVPVEKVVIQEKIVEVMAEKVVIQEKIVEVMAETKDTARLALGTIPFHMVPGAIPSLQSRTSWRMLFGAFGMQDESNGSAVPHLASWELIGDDTLVVSIPPGQFHHNGEEITAEATVEQIDYLNGQQKFGFVNWNLWSAYDGWEATDKYTFEAFLSKPTAKYAVTLGVHVPLPTEYLKEKGPPGFSDEPIGNGPYEMVDWERDAFIKATRWADYKGGHPSAMDGMPVIKDLEFRFVPEDAVRGAGLEAGDFDIAAVLPPEVVARVLQKGFRIFAGDSQQSFTVWLDHNHVTPELEDVRVRRAMSYAVDIDKIHEKIAGGYGTKLQCQLVAPGGFGYNSSLENWPYDPDKARALMKEAGLESGFSIQGSASVARYYRDDQVMTALQAYWKDINIDVPIQFMESAVWLEAAMEGALPPIWNIGLNWWFADNSNIPQKAGFDTTLDDLKAKAVITLDNSKRDSIVQDAAARACDQAYGLWFYTIPALYGLNPELPDISFNLAFEMIIPTK